MPLKKLIITRNRSMQAITSTVLSTPLRLPSCPPRSPPKAKTFHAYPILLERASMFLNNTHVLVVPDVSILVIASSSITVVESFAG